MVQADDSLRTQYREIQEHIDRHCRGQCSAAEVKRVSAPLGIYAERDGGYMMRLRRLNGEFPVAAIEHVAAVMEASGTPQAHFTTRCNVQLHGGAPHRVGSVLDAFAGRGMAFRGGGGNTLRSISGPAFAGVSPAGAFDPAPYMQRVWEHLCGYDRAFALGRKFKLAFADAAADGGVCAVQDLGLIAVVQNGLRGFRVLGGGGLGRGAAAGMELVAFLPAERVVQAVTAAVDLFYDRGERENRARARLRFLRRELGDERFRTLYRHYLAESIAPLVSDVTEIDYAALAGALTRFEQDAPSDEAYRSWLKRAVSATRFADAFSVRLFVGGGRLTAGNLRNLAMLLQQIGAHTLRLTARQDALIPLVHRTALPVVHRFVREGTGGNGLDGGAVAGHIVACVGARLCAVGLLDSQAAAARIAAALDTLLDGYAEIRDDVYAGILDGIRLSGCGSCCALSQTAAIGLHGHRMAISGVMTDGYGIHIGGGVAADASWLARTEPEWWIEAEAVDRFIVALVREYLDDYRAGRRRSLRDFMRRKRDGFDPLVYTPHR